MKSSTHGKCIMICVVISFPSYSYSYFDGFVTGSFFLKYTVLKF